MKDTRHRGSKPIPRGPELELTLDSGEHITAATDLDLARQWARAELGDQWGTLTPARRAVEVADALESLRAQYWGTDYLEYHG
jgi:hypothetical protein